MRFGGVGRPAPSKLGPAPSRDADQRRSLGPRFGFAVGDADHHDLIIGQQRLRFRADRFVEGEDVELGAEDVRVVHRDEFNIQFRRAPLNVRMSGGHPSNIVTAYHGRARSMGVP